MGRKVHYLVVLVVSSNVSVLPLSSLALCSCSSTEEEGYCQAEEHEQVLLQGWEHGMGWRTVRAGRVHHGPLLILEAPGGAGNA